LLEASLHTVAGNSDSATVVLEGAAMSHGHVGLHGWSLTADSFWSVDALFYAVATSIVGVRAIVMNAVPSVIAAITIVVGALIASKGLNLRGSVAASAFVVALLGLPGSVLAYFLLQGPWHVGTTLWCLLAFYALVSRPTRLNFVLAVALLAAAILGDPMALAIGCVPILAWGLLAVATDAGQRAWRPVFAVGASALSALVLRAVAFAFGGFAVVSRRNSLRPAQMGWNLSHLGIHLGALLGVTSLPTGTPQDSTLFHAVRLVTAVFVAAGVSTALWRLIGSVVHHQSPRNPAQRVDDLLVIAFFADLATYVIFSPGPAVNNVRYLLPAVVIGAIVSARFVGRAAASMRDRRALVATGLLGFVAIAFAAIGPIDLLRSPRPARPGATLTAFLEKKGLTEGVGDYWSSSIITVDSRQHVVVRPVITDGHNRIIRDDRQSDVSWYANRPFEFLVYNTVGPGSGVDLQSASATFGRPARTYIVGTYRLLEWDHPVRISSSVLEKTGGPFRGYWEP
jgi:hypothetical protein